MKGLIRILAVTLFVIPLFAAAADAIDINTADKQELMQLSGVGEARAEAIIDYREKHGEFASVDELGEVSGIGTATLDNNRDMLTAGADD